MSAKKLIEIEKEIKNRVQLFEKKINYFSNLNHKKWLTVKEAAEYLGCTPSAIYNVIYRGQLQRRRIGGKVFLKRSEIDLLLETSF